MPEARIRSLKVRPLHSSDLSLNMPGILAERLPLGFLGRRITLTEVEGNAQKPPFSFREAIYDHIGKANPDGTMELSPARIEAILRPHALFTLRNETLRVALEQMICQRHSAYLERYQHDENRKKYAEELFKVDAQGNPLPGGKVQRLLDLKADYEKRHTDLVAAYAEDSPDKVDRKGVVKLQVTNHDNTVLYTDGNAIETTAMVQPLSMKQDNYRTVVHSDPDQKIDTPDVFSKPLKIDRSDLTLDDNGRYVASVTSSKYPEGKGTEMEQTSKTFLTEYSHPTLDSKLRNTRAQADLLDEILSNKTFALRVPSLEKIWANELAMLDAEVAKLQLNYAHSFLVSPIPGMVTAVYKNAGESVQAGEPILRVEDDSELLLVGSILYRSGIHVGNTVKVVVDNLFENGVPVEIADGRVVSIRGHDADNDEWDVIVSISNPISGGKRLLPLNYTFDRDETRLVIS